MSNVKAPSNTLVVLPVGRVAALSRGLLWCVPVALLGLAVGLVFPNLDLAPTGAANRIVDYSVALLLLPVAVAALLCAALAFRWVLLALWPGSIGVYAGEDELVLRLGPFGTRRYDTGRLTVRYPFEWPLEEKEGNFEAFLPEDEQRRSFVPALTHPDARERIDRFMLRFVAGGEAAAAAVLRPALDRWRARSGVSDDEAGD